MIYEKYSLMGEHISFTIALMVLFLMIKSKPKNTNSYFMILSGMILSLFQGVLTFVIHKWVNFVTPDAKIAFYTVCFWYLFHYSIILFLLYNYVYTFSMNNINRIKIRWTNVFSLLLYNVLALYFLVSGKLFVFQDHYCRVTLFHDFGLFFGFLALVTILIVIIINRKNLPRVIFEIVVLCMLADGVIISFQKCVPTIRFESLGYVLPFVVAYIVFHSIPYDQITGCQNFYSYQAKFDDKEFFHSKYMITYIRFKQLRFYDYLNNRSADNDLFAMTCRKIEELDKSARFYRLDDNTFALFTSTKKEGNARKHAEDINRIITSVMNQANTKIKYNVVSFFCNELINNQELLDAIQNYLFEKIEDDDQNNFYIATQDDFENVHQSYVIEKQLEDICIKKDLDDPRVLCYTQPIYCVKDKAFRTAESLIRLQIDGKIYSPGQFIGIAEKKKYIHVLTCIMLNKACKELKKLQKQYVIDGISINCTSTEFSERHLYQELLDIIRANDIDPYKIKVELTESDIFSNMNVVLYNMTRLKNEGIQFYLDDFGTGYSNVERILECPFGMVKFDKTLLYKAMEQKRFETIQDHMIAALKGIGLKILVEGVETETQKNYCIEHQFEYIQGFYLVKPVPIAELKSYLEKY